MPNILTLVMAVAAILFVALSATMNALFLSSLGRTAIETSLLALVSVASDLAKAVLPVVIVRAIQLRVWSQVTVATLMLLFVVVLSLASGIGFAALTRGTSIAVRLGQSDTLAAAKRDLQDVETRLNYLTVSRPTRVVEAAFATAIVDRRWSGSKECTEISGQAVRQYCTDVQKLKAEGTVSAERETLVRERAALRSKIESLNGTGNIDSDPQSALVAQLLGTDAAVPRLILTTFTAAVIELGSVLLILLVTGPTLLGWREPEGEAPYSPTPVTLPSSRDVTHWHRRRAAVKLTGGRDSGHE